MKYCNEYAALLDLYVDGELDAANMIRVQEHLDTCPACQAYVDDALAIRAAFPDVEETVVPENFTAKVMDSVRKAPRQRRKNIHWSKVLAPLAACFALVIVLRYMPAGGSSTSVLTKTAAPTAEEAAPESAMEVLADTHTYSTQAEAPMEETKMEAAPMAPVEELAGGESSAVESESGIVETDAEMPVSEPEEPELVEVSAFLTVLFLPPEAAELLEDFTPIQETETEVQYQLLKADCDRLQAQLKEAGISYMAEDAVASATNVALVLLSK